MTLCQRCKSESYRALDDEYAQCVKCGAQWRLSSAAVDDAQIPDYEAMASCGRGT